MSYVAADGCRVLVVDRCKRTLKGYWSEILKMLHRPMGVRCGEKWGAPFPFILGKKHGYEKQLYKNTC